MLLPTDCIVCKIVTGRVLPGWLGDGDEPFVESVLDSVAGFEGLQVGDADLIAPAQLAKLGRERKMPPYVGEALWHIERKRWSARIDAPTDPETLRDLVFELSAHLPREEAIEEGAKRLQIANEAVVGSLFADRQSRRVLVAPEQPANATDLIARYNLALVQTLLSRSMEVVVTLRGDPSLVVAAAKRDGLLAEFALDGETTTLTLAGPLALFRDTSKYGRSIARFVPSLLASQPASAGGHGRPSWSLRARVMLGMKSASFELDHAGAIAFATMPAAPDARLARKVARTLRSVGVRIDLHPTIMRVGSSLVVPDFALEWAGGRVLVDVVPFATPEYLACKATTVSMLDVPMLVCVDQRFIPEADVEKRPWLVPYRQEIDAWALLNAARAAVADRESRGALS